MKKTILTVLTLLFTLNLNADSLEKNIIVYWEGNSTIKSTYIYDLEKDSSNSDADFVLGEWVSDDDMLAMMDELDELDKSIVAWEAKWKKIQASIAAGEDILNKLNKIIAWS